MSDREKVIQDLRTLIGQETVTIDPKDTSPKPEQIQPFQETMAYLKQRAQEEGEKRGKPFHITELESNGRPMLIIGTHDTKTPDVAILTHIDTVEPKKSEREGERSEQLKLRLKIVDREERAYGRGTYDMKYAAVAGLGILADLPKEDDGLSVSLMFTSDEEKGAKNGAQVLYNEGYKPKFLIVPDGSGSWTVTATSRALWHFRIENIPGKNAHASRPWEGENALRRAYKFDEQLSRRHPNPKEPSSDMTLNLGNIGVPRKKDKDGKEKDVQLNTVPDKAFLHYDARFGSQEELEKFTEEVEQLVAKKLHGATVETDVKYPYYESDLSNSDAKLLIQIMKEKLGHKPEIVNSFGATDAVHFPDVPSFITMIDGAGAHSDNEWVSMKGIFTFIDILREFIHKKAESHKTRR